jgi:hypothetical protein
MEVGQIHWIAPDFRRVARHDAWQGISLLCAFSLGIIAFLERSFVFFAVVIVLEFFALIGTKRFRHVEESYWLSEDGLWVGQDLIYTREEVWKFALTDHTEEKIVPWSELIVVSKVGSPSVTKILLPHEDAPAIRSYLIDQWGIQEFDYQPGAKEMLVKAMGL